jgi:hypothetical protein
MYDAIVPERIPRDAQWVAGYVDGDWATFDRLHGLFPHAKRLVSITTGIEVADVIDVERGNATPEAAVEWVLRMRSEFKRRPIVYTSRANVGAIYQAFADRHAAPPFLWAADWTNAPHLVPGSVGTQWTSSDLYDISEISAKWPSRFLPRTEKIIRMNSVRKA